MVGDASLPHTGPTPLTTHPFQNFDEAQGLLQRHEVYLKSRHLGGGGRCNDTERRKPEQTHNSNRFLLYLSQPLLLLRHKGPAPTPVWAPPRGGLTGNVQLSLGRYTPLEAAVVSVTGVVSGYSLLL